EFAVYVHAPFVPIVNLPFVRSAERRAGKVGALSTSLIVSVPEVVIAASVSSTDTTSELTTAASLVPLIVTRTYVGVPSAASTVNWSDTESPTFSVSNAEFAVYVHAPFVPIVNLPFV